MLDTNTTTTMTTVTPTTVDQASSAAAANGEAHDKATDNKRMSVPARKPIMCKAPSIKNRRMQ